MTEPTRFVPLRGNLTEPAAKRRMTYAHSALTLSMFSVREALFASLADHTSANPVVLLEADTIDLRDQPLHRTREDRLQRMVAQGHFTQHPYQVDEHDGFPHREPRILAHVDRLVDDLRSRGAEERDVYLRRASARTPRALAILQRQTLQYVFQMRYAYKLPNSAAETAHVYSASVTFPHWFACFYADFSMMDLDAERIAELVDAKSLASAASLADRPYTPLVAERPELFVRSAGAPNATVLGGPERTAIRGRHQWMCLPLRVEIWDVDRIPAEYKGIGQNWTLQRNGLVFTTLFLIASALFPEADVLGWVHRAAAVAAAPMFDWPWSPPDPSVVKRPAWSGESPGQLTVSAFRRGDQQIYIPEHVWLQRFDRGAGECILWSHLFPFWRHVRGKSVEQIMSYVDRSATSAKLRPMSARFQRWADAFLARCRDRAQSRAEAQVKTADSALIDAVLARRALDDTDERHDVTMETEMVAEELALADEAYQHQLKLLAQVKQPRRQQQDDKKTDVASAEPRPMDLDRDLDTELADELEDMRILASVRVC